MQEIHINSSDLPPRLAAAKACYNLTSSSPGNVNSPFSVGAGRKPVATRYAKSIGT